MPLEFPDPEPLPVSPAEPASEPNFQFATLEAPPLPAREPFWGYLDLAMLVGLAVAFFAALCMPIVLIFKPQVGKSSFVLVTLAVQVALYASIYLALRLVFTRYHQPVFRSLGWRRVPFNLGWPVLWGVSLTAVVGGVIYFLHAPQVPSPVDQLVTSRASLIGVALLAALAAPVFEEALFRGFLQPLLARSLGVVAGILITAVLFGALHIPEYSFAWQYGLAITVVGAAFGYARYRTNSLITSTVMHASFNTISVIGLFYTKFPSLK